MCGNLSKIRLNEGGMKSKRKDDLETGRVERAKVVPANLGWLVVANHIHEKAGPFKICVARGVDEGKMELAATFGDLTGNVRCNQQRWHAVGPASGLDQGGSFEPVHGFDFSEKAVFPSVRDQLEDHIGCAVMPGCHRMDRSAETGGPFESLSGSI